MASTPDDTSENNNDPHVKTLADVCEKYYFREEVGAVVLRTTKSSGPRNPSPSLLVSQGWKDSMKQIARFPIIFTLPLLEKFGDHGQMGGAATVGDVLSKDENIAELTARGDRLIASLEKVRSSTTLAAPLECNDHSIN